MNKQQLEAKLDEVYMISARLRVAIMRAVGRDPHDWPPSDEVLIAELARLAAPVTPSPVDGFWRGLILAMDSRRIPLLACTICYTILPVSEMYSVDACSEKCQSEINARSTPSASDRP